MPEILISVTNKIPQLVGDVRQITSGNRDYRLRLIFDDDWEDGEKTVLFVRENGFVYPPVRTENDECVIPEVNGVPIREWLYIGVKQGEVHTSRPCGVTVYRSINDMIDDEAVQPDPSMWEDVLERLEELEKSGGGGTAPAGTDLVGHAMVALAGASYDSLAVEGITYPPGVTDEADQQRMLRAGAVKAVVSIFESEDNVEAGVLDCIEGDGFTWVFAGVMVGKKRTAFVTVQSIEDSNEYEANVLAVHEGGGSSGDAMRLKARVEVPYEGTPPIIDMIDFTREYTFADIREAFVAGRTITLNTEWDVGPVQYGMFWIEGFAYVDGVGGLKFHGHYWRVKDVGADVDEGWVPAVAFLREDGTLTVEDREWIGYAKQTEVDKLSKAKVNLPTNADGTPNHGTVGYYAVSDGAGGIKWTESGGNGGTETDDPKTIALSDWVYGYIMADGTHMAGGNGWTSGFVEVRKGYTYTAVYPAEVGNVRFAVYDANKVFRYRIIDGTYTYTAESDGYIKITTEEYTGYADVYLSVTKATDTNSGTGNNFGFLKGLKYYALGDSIVDMQGTLTTPETFGDTGCSKDLQNRDISGITVEGYVTAIERRYGLVATNYGKGGHTLVGDYSTLASMNYSNVALVTIAYGVNDARTGVPLGTVNSTDGTTFAGALNNILRKIYTDNPECRVLVLSPMQRLTVTNFGISTPNVNGDYLIDFVDMCRKVAEKRSTAFLDQYRCTGINQTNLYYYTVEGVHPVNQGFARIRNAVISILDELFALEYEPIGAMTNTGDIEPEEPDTGGDSGGEEPPEEDTGATIVELTSDMFSMDGLYIDASGTIQQKANTLSNPEPIELIPGKTYTLVTYLSNQYADTKAYSGVLANSADFPTTTGGVSLRTDKIGASFEDNAAIFGNINHAKITYTWVASASAKYLFTGTTKLSDDLMITLSYV